MEYDEDLPVKPAAEDRPVPQKSVEGPAPDVLLEVAEMYAPLLDETCVTAKVRDTKIDGPPAEESQGCEIMEPAAEDDAQKAGPDSEAMDEVAHHTVEDLVPQKSVMERRYKGECIAARRNMYGSRGRETRAGTL